jgi:hypothetical protein
VQSSQSEPRRPDFREAAETLEQALTEACASPSAHEADTGELIRVEEMLSLAGDAARRAISIRRKARHDAELGGEELPAAEPEVVRELAATAEPTQASHRFFDDARGVRWDVWAVYPEARAQLSALPGSFRTGWLVFESATEKRRLSPIPDGWLMLPTVELERLCKQASAAQRRTRSPTPDAIPRVTGEDTDRTD